MLASVNKCIGENTVFYARKLLFIHSTQLCSTTASNYRQMHVHTLTWVIVALSVSRSCKIIIQSLVIAKSQTANRAVSMSMELCTNAREFNTLRVNADVVTMGIQCLLGTKYLRGLSEQCDQ